MTPARSSPNGAAALVQSQITAEDLVIPRLYIGQSVSSAVVNNHAPLGSLYLATDRDDPEPVVIYKPDQKTGSCDVSVGGVTGREARGIARRG